MSVAALVLTAVILYALFGTKYEAKMKVLVRRGRADAPVSAGVNAPLDLTRVAVTEEELNSEVELLHGADVLRRVAEETGVGERDWKHLVHLDESRAERIERSVRCLAKKIQVTPVKKTNLISISYATDDPEMAQRVLQSLAGAYLEKHKMVHRPGGELRFFEQQLGASRQELEDSKRACCNSQRRTERSPQVCSVTWPCKN